MTEFPRGRTEAIRREGNESGFAAPEDMRPAAVQAAEAPDGTTPPAKPRIAVFSGPLATISNNAPLVTSNKARRKHGLPLADIPDVLRPQRLAAPVTVYVAAHSAHPLEADAAALYAPPDGWLDEHGTFHERQPAGGGTAVYVVELRPEDGLYPLPYMARKADGTAWEDAMAEPLASTASARQTFFPDASRLYEEVERLGVGGDGRAVGLWHQADFDFFRAVPSGGWTGGQAAEERTDVGEGPIPVERNGLDFFAYAPLHLYREPSLGMLARATNRVQRALSNGDYAGMQWLESSPTIEDTLYWLNLTIDTELPIVGHSAQRAHGTLSADGDRNIVDGLKYILSGVWRDEAGRDRVGAVLVVDEVVFASREVTKVDARPGGYDVVGGHGGVVADMGAYAPPQVTFVPNRRHTHASLLRLPLLPASVHGVRGGLSSDRRVIEVAVRDSAGDLIGSAMPTVSFVKYGHYVTVPIAAESTPDPRNEVEILARVEANLAGAPLAGFVVEGMSPYGMSDPATDSALAVAALCGMPVVRVGGGNTGGMAYKRDPLAVAGNNLSASKARMLLMAALLKFGALPIAKDPFQPTAAEIAAVTSALSRYQAIFDTH
ncbi:asparaginase domain-containing protein [Streptomyces sp. NBC_01320]|uniref:asparaginase domain-containing protein n=1 Tax=Streptomyces sp. NBC_01320 TaxID=2903824 RepID=UPI002E0D814E|nr:hypothetical protein OG395_07015 [Streptomyces sp. NBC_01320]